MPVCEFAPERILPLERTTFDEMKLHERRDLQRLLRENISVRLAKFLALIAVVSWRISFVTMSARAKPDTAPCSVLTFAEITTLHRIDASRTRPRRQRRALAAYLLPIAMLGGYLARKHDPPPGNMVVWRGMIRLHDITFGISIGSRRRCG